MPTQRYQMMPQGLDPCLCRVPCSVPAAIVLATPAVRRAPQLAWTWCCGSLAPSGGPLAPSMRGPLAGVWLRKVVRGVRGSEVEASAGLDGRLHQDQDPNTELSRAAVVFGYFCYKRKNGNRQVPRLQVAQASAAPTQSSSNHWAHTSGRGCRSSKSSQLFPGTLHSRRGERVLVGPRAIDRPLARALTSWEVLTRSWRRDRS